ncbi:MAG: GntR family histidine utilization transcriptional repressor [Halieaceae bacterium]
MADSTALEGGRVNLFADSFTGIDKASPEPLYSQIKAAIQGGIKSGYWLPGQKLPSENELVEALDVSRMTANRALRELGQEGLVNRVHGLGSFVAEPPRHASLIQLQDIALDIAAGGGVHSARVLKLERLKASESVAKAMELKRGTELYYLKSVHMGDGLPMQLESRYVNPAMMPAFIDQDFSRITSTSYLLGQFRPDEMEHNVRAVIPGINERRQLSTDESEPCLQLSRRTWKDHRVVTWVTMTYPGSRYELGARYATSDFKLL